MKDTHYQTILNTVIDGQCVLVMGPELFRFDDKLLSVAVNDHLKKTGADEEVLFYDYKDELFYFRGETDDARSMAKNTVYRAMRNYLEGFAPGELHEKIARLPFPLIINLAPDHLLVNAFEKCKIDYRFDYYDKNVNPDPDNIQNKYTLDKGAPSADKPMIYNLVGHIGHEESLIMTYSDLFDFLFNVFGRNNLPLALREKLEIQDGNEKKDYLFLGFRFNKWYLQIFLRLLNANGGKQRWVLGEDAREMEALANDYKQEDKGFFYLQKYFTLRLTDGSPEDLIHRLYEDCEKAGKLRALNTLKNEPEQLSGDRPLHFLLHDLMLRNQVREVIQLMLDYFQAKSDMNEQVTNLLTLGAAYENLNQSENKGLLYSEERFVERNRICNALSVLIQELRKSEPDL